MMVYNLTSFFVLSRYSTYRNNWNFPTLDLGKLSHGHTLLVVGITSFRRLGIFDAWAMVSIPCSFLHGALCFQITKILSVQTCETGRFVSQWAVPDSAFWHSFFDFQLYTLAQLLVFSVTYKIIHVSSNLLEGLYEVTRIPTNTAVYTRFIVVSTNLLTCYFIYTANTHYNIYSNFTAFYTFKLTWMEPMMFAGFFMVSADTNQPFATSPVVYSTLFKMLQYILLKYRYEYIIL